jgi:hypothetical protein
MLANINDLLPAARNHDKRAIRSVEEKCCRKIDLKRSSRLLTSSILI